MPRTFRVTRYVFFCEQCETWYTKNDVITTCRECGAQVRELHADEREEFLWRMEHSGYKIVVPRGRGKKKDGNVESTTTDAKASKAGKATNVTKESTAANTKPVTSAKASTTPTTCTNITHGQDEQL